MAENGFQALHLPNALLMRHRGWSCRRRSNGRSQTSLNKNSAVHCGMSRHQNCHDSACTSRKKAQYSSHAPPYQGPRQPNTWLHIGLMCRKTSMFSHLLYILGYWDCCLGNDLNFPTLHEEHMIVSRSLSLAYHTD